MALEGTDLLTKCIASRVLPRADNARKLREYLGLLHFYRRFIPRCAQLLHPLTDELQDNIKKSRAVHWTEGAQLAHIYTLGINLMLQEFERIDVKHAL